MKLIGCCLVLPLALAAQVPKFDQRVRAVVEAYAHPANAGPLGYANIAAKLWLHEDAALCSNRLEELLAAGPTGDMFWMYPITAIAYLDRGQLTDSARHALRESYRTYMPYRGDTENHWVMYYSSLYLMAQLWPNQDGQQWYTGKSSAENMREAAGWLEQVGPAHHHARARRIRQPELYGLLLPIDVLPGSVGGGSRHAQARFHDD